MRILSFLLKVKKQTNKATTNKTPVISKDITQVEFRASTLKRYHKGKLTKRVYPDQRESNHNTQILIEDTKL